MNISSTSSGLYPALLPLPRRPAAERAAGPATTAAADARSQPPAAPLPAPPNPHTSTSLLQAHQRVGVAAQVNEGSLGPRAVAAYTAVAAQERRSALSEVLVGIDVFA